MSPLAALSLLWTLAGPGPAAVPSPAPESLAPDVFLVPGTFVRGSQPDGNTVVFRSTEGLLVVDTGRHAEHVQAILSLAASTRLPVRAVVNTHWHLDHVSGNPAIRRAHPGAEVVASDAIEDALAGFLARYRKQLEAMLAEEKDPAARRRWTDEIGRIDAGSALGPTRVLRQGETLTLAGRRVELGLATGAATAGDVWLFDPASGVLAAGDLVTLPAPLLDTACPEGWRVAVARLSDVPFRTLVPGHGRPMNRADLGRWRTALDRLLACAATEAPANACADGWVADLGPLLPDADRPFARELLGYYVPEVLRAPPSKVAERCRTRTGTGFVR